jgi:hypothetical protein
MLGKVEGKLAIEPELRRGAESLRQPQRVEGVIPRLPFTISFSRTYETPIRSANSACVMPSGLMNSSSSISPGGVGGCSAGIRT